MRRRFLPIALVATAVVAACGGGGQDDTASQTPAQVNVFQNPGLEEGRDPWFSLREPEFTLSEDIARTGEASALLQMRADPQEEAKGFYLVQEVTPGQIPEVLSGHYQVTAWTPGTRLQYLQVVVIVFGADNLPGDYPSHQIRYILAGIDEEPFAIENAQFVFLDGEDPPLEQWVPFEVNVRDDFQRLWGAVPKGFEKIRVLFEVRYDSKAPDETPEADVYYDDLYFGPPSGAGIR
jgi:hypothetical protein